MREGFEAAWGLLPPRMRRGAPSPELIAGAEEFRLRCGRPPTALIGERERTLDAAPVTGEELRRVLDAATASSFHAVTEQLRRGFVSAGHGVRVGVCGTAARDGSGVRTLRELSSLAIRVPRQVAGAGAGLLPELMGESVLALSPPGGGKTTFLRELLRFASERGVRVGVADERGELAACFGGIPGFDLGPCADIVTGAPKAEAALMLLRAMNPQAVALDELSDPADAAAVTALAGCGVLVYASAHAGSVAELRKKRGVTAALLDAGVFTRAVVIENRGGVRSYRAEAL